MAFSISRCHRAAALIPVMFSRGIPRAVRHSGLIRIFGRAGAPFSDLSGSPGERAFQKLQKEMRFQIDKRIALYAWLVCVDGMDRAVFFANENKSASGERKIMIDQRSRK
jgi:hypothetical protein